MSVCEYLKNEVHEILAGEWEYWRSQKGRLERFQLPLLYQHLSLRLRWDSRAIDLESTTPPHQPPPHNLHLPLELRQQHRRYGSRVSPHPFRVDFPGLRIAISIFSLLLWFPISLYLFYIPYRVYMREDDKICLFYILSLLVAVFFSIWSIANFADANGWIMMAWGVTNGKGSVAFFSFFTAIFSTLVVVLTVTNLYKFYKRESTSVEEWYLSFQEWMDGWCVMV